MSEHSDSGLPIKIDHIGDHSEQSATPEEAHEECDQAESRQISHRRRRLLAGAVVLSAIVGIAVSLLISMQGRNSPPAAQARVVLQDATILGPLVQHNVPTATVLLKNTGQSAALTTRMRLVMTVWPSTYFPNWKMPLELSVDAVHLGTIAPGLVVSQEVSLLAPLTDVQGMHLERKDWFIVILGVVSYVDLSGNEHQMDMCLIWREVTTGRLSLCERWNERY